jgi:hypothetical protein
MPVPFTVSALRACVVLAGVGLLTSTAVRATPGDFGGGATPPPVLTVNHGFYVLVDPGSDRSVASVIAITMAGEFNKVFRPLKDQPDSTKVWAIPEATWAPDQLATRCENDANAIGGVVLSYYVGDASHFWILWQTDTTTFSLFGQFVSCNRDAAKKAHPETVAIVSQLHGSNGQLWIERRSQTSVPLLSFAAVVALLGRHYSSKSTSSSVNTSIALASVGAAVVGQGLNKDIPGYSLPLRLRYGSLHVADDIIREMRYLCGVPQKDDLAGASHPPPPDPTTPFGDLCNQTGVTR